MYIPFPQQFTHLLASRQRLAADNKAAGIPIQTVADRRTEGAQTFPGNLSLFKQVINQPLIQRIIFRRGFL